MATRARVVRRTFCVVPGREYDNKGSCGALSLCVVPFPAKYWHAWRSSSSSSAVKLQSQPGVGQFLECERLW
eukprot:360627-Chlamydomonas_euryale.AAC.5